MLPFRLLLLVLALLLLLLLLSFCLAAILSPNAPLARALCREGLLADADDATSTGAFAVTDADFAVAGVVFAVAGVAFAVAGVAIPEGVVVAATAAVVSSVSAAAAAAAAAFGLRKEVLVPKGALKFFILANFFSWDTCATLWETRFRMAMLECTNWRSPPATTDSFFLNPAKMSSGRS